MTQRRASTKPFYAALIGASLALGFAHAHAHSPSTDPRIVGVWESAFFVNPELTLRKDGTYRMVALTQTKTEYPEEGAYTVLPLPNDRGRLKGAKLVRLRHVLPPRIAQELHRSTIVTEDLTFVPSLPALVGGKRQPGSMSSGNYVPVASTDAAHKRLRRWLAAS